MQSADLRNRNDAPARWRLHFPRMGAFVVEGLMRALYWAKRSSGAWPVASWTVR
jgi:hypothetical protein